jgi:hypothetical protein
MLYEKKSHAAPSLQPSRPLEWLLLAVAVTMVMSFAVIAMRRWQRHAYREVNEVAQEARAELNTERNDEP